MYLLVRSILALIAGISIILLSFYLGLSVSSRISAIFPDWKIKLLIVQAAGGAAGVISGGFVASIMLWIPWTRQIAPSTFFIGLPLGSSIGVMMASLVLKGGMSRWKGLLGFLGSFVAVVAMGALSPGSYFLEDTWVIGLFMLASLVGGIIGYDIPDLLRSVARR